MIYLQITPLTYAYRIETTVDEDISILITHCHCDVIENAAPKNGTMRVVSKHEGEFEVIIAPNDRNHTGVVSEIEELLSELDGRDKSVSTLT